MNILCCVSSVIGEGDVLIFSLKFWGGGGRSGTMGGRFYLREAFESQTHTEKILYNESH